MFNLASRHSHQCALRYQPKWSIDSFWPLFVYHCYCCRPWFLCILCLVFVNTGLYCHSLRSLISVIFNLVSHVAQLWTWLKCFPPMTNCSLIAMPHNWLTIIFPSFTGSDLDLSPAIGYSWLTRSEIDVWLCEIDCVSVDSVAAFGNLTFLCFAALSSCSLLYCKYKLKWPFFRNLYFSLSRWIEQRRITG